MESMVLLLLLVAGVRDLAIVPSSESRVDSKRDPGVRGGVGERGMNVMFGSPNIGALRTQSGITISTWRGLSRPIESGESLRELGMGK